MRCFIAIEFDQETRSYLAGIQGFLREHAIRGNYSHLSNLHITLKFLGEINPAIIPGLESVMKKVAAKHGPFVLELGELGKFSKGSRPIIWCGVKPNKLLFDLQKNLVDELAGDFRQFSGYEKFTPHITLIREAALDVANGEASEGNPLDDILKKAPKRDRRFMVKGLSLMESTRRDGRLVYLQKSFIALREQ